MVHSGRMEGAINKAVTYKTYSFLLGRLPPAQRELLLYGYMLLGLPCSCSGHTTQILSSQLQPRVLEESRTTFENAEREHAPIMLLHAMDKLAHYQPSH